METKSSNKTSGLDLKKIFRCMMEDGHYPSFEHTHIQFDIGDNIGVVECEDGIVSVRLFFSIEKEAYKIFLEASNMTMVETFMVKPVVLEDMKNIMFSCEMFCDTISQFRRFLPRSIAFLKEALAVHRSEMQKLVLAHEVASKAVPATEDLITGTGRKILS